MIKNCFVTVFLLKVLIVSFLTLTVYSSGALATGSPSGDDAEFMSEMNEVLRHPDEPDIYPDDHLSVSGSAIETQNTTPIPYNIEENAGNLNGQADSQGEINNKSKNDETWIARPGDPEAEYPTEPDTLAGELIDVMEDLMESEVAVTAGIVVILLLVGMGIVKFRKKPDTLVGRQVAPSFAPAPKVTEKTTQPLKQVLASFCASCGLKLQPDARFCTNCGEKI